MKILYELSWLWETLGIALLAAAICIACAALICKAAKKALSKKLLTEPASYAVPPLIFCNHCSSRNSGNRMCG